MGRNLFVLCFWFLQIYCLVSDYHTIKSFQDNNGPCMDVNKSYALPRHNPVKVRHFNRFLYAVNHADCFLKFAKDL